MSNNQQGISNVQGIMRLVSCINGRLMTTNARRKAYLDIGHSLLDIGHSQVPLTTTTISPFTSFDV
jgi:hypothetical protein